MDSRPLRVCATPRCGTPVPKGYCLRCRPTHREHSRPTDPRYGTMQWRRYSAQRKQEHPFCERCGLLAAGPDTNGRSRGVTDHIVPVVEAPDRFDDPTNHRTLCIACNAIVRAERGLTAHGHR
jgi:5-methylcytosine-specific restriction endonuclease McrA